MMRSRTAPDFSAGSNDDDDDDNRLRVLRPSASCLSENIAEEDEEDEEKPRGAGFKAMNTVSMLSEDEDGVGHKTSADTHKSTVSGDIWSEKRTVAANPLSQYLGDDANRKYTFGERIQRSLQWFYGVPHTQTFNLHQLRIQGTTDDKFIDIVRNLMNVRGEGAHDLDDVSTMLRDTRQQWSFFDILEADVPRSLFWVLCHFSILGQMIQTTLAMIAFYSSWYCSLIVAYDPVLQYDADLHPGSATYSTLQRFDIGLDVMFFVGTLTQLRTTFIDRDHFVETCQPGKIWWKTLRSISFWVDLVSCFPAIFVYAFPGTPLQLLLVKVFMRLHCTLLWIFDINNVGLQMQPYWQQILRLILFIVLFGHTMGCLWHSVSSPLDHPLLQGAGGGKRWIHPEYADRPLFLYYSYFSKTGLYLALGIIVQGYSLTENAFIVILAPLGSVANALILSSIIVLVSRKTALETHTLEQVANLKQAISTQGLPPTIQLRLTAYHTQKRVHRCRSQTENIFRGLSSQLHFELNLVLYCNLLIEADIFKKSHPRVIRQIVLVFDDKLFLPGDYVCRYDDEGSEMYFIFKGMLDVYSDTYVQLCTMKKGQHFGEVALLTGQRRTAYVQAKMFCMLASLSKANFDGIMREFPQQYDVIMQQMSAKRRIWMQSLVKQQREKDEKRMSLVKRSFSGVLGGAGGGVGGLGSTNDEEEVQKHIASALKRGDSFVNGASSTPMASASSMLTRGGSALFNVTKTTDDVEEGKLAKIIRSKDDALFERRSSRVSFAGDSSEAGKDAGSLTMVIPFDGDKVVEKKKEDGEESDDSDDEEDSDANDSDDSDANSGEGGEKKSSGSGSGSGSDEDIVELVNAVAQHCSMALKGNERICTRLKEITQRQAQSAESAGKLSSLFEAFLMGQGAEDRNVKLEYLCNDVDNIQRAIKECNDQLDQAEEEHSKLSHRNIIAMGTLDKQDGTDDQETTAGAGDDDDDDDDPRVRMIKSSSLPSTSDDAERTVL